MLDRTYSRNDQYLLIKEQRVVYCLEFLEPCREYLVVFVPGLRIRTSCSLIVYLYYMDVIVFIFEPSQSKVIPL